MRALEWPGLLLAGKYLVSAPSGLLVEMRSRRGEQKVDWVGRRGGTGVHQCWDSRCIGGILERPASHEREASMGGAGGESNVGYTEEGIGKRAAEVWTASKAGKMTPGPPCAHRGRGGEVGDFCVQPGALGGGLARKYDLSPERALCGRAEWKQ